MLKLSQMSLHPFNKEVGNDGCITLGTYKKFIDPRVLTVKDFEEVFCEPYIEMSGL